MVDRTTPPPFSVTPDINILEVRHKVLDNGLDLYYLNAGQQPVLRFEMVFNAGRWFEPSGSVSSFTMKMLGEGTSSRSAFEIASFFDRYGAYTDFRSGFDTATATLYSMNRFLETVLQEFVEVVTQPSFPDDQLQIRKQIAIQERRVNLEKNSFVAAEEFRGKLLGSSHPYGRTPSEEVIEGIESGTLSSYHKNNIIGGRPTLLLSGLVKDEDLELINNVLGQLKFGQTNVSDEHEAKTQLGSFVTEKEESVQSSIRMGKMSLPMDHPDYHKFMVVNELFGGFFGSRLMKNIREEKGFTYGIYSSIRNHQHADYMVIGTDVKKEFTTRTIDEIYKELKTITSAPPDQEELDTVRNYIFGSLQNALTTPFALMDQFRHVHFHGLDYSFYDKLIDDVKNIDRDSFLGTARKYLYPDDFCEVVVGGME